MSHQGGAGGGASLRKSRISAAREGEEGPLRRDARGSMCRAARIPQQLEYKMHERSHGDKLGKMGLKCLSPRVPNVLLRKLKYMTHKSIGATQGFYVFVSF